MKTNLKTWSPFQSPQLREICAHLTDAEQNEVSRRAGLYGLWAAFTFALPTSIAIFLHNRVILVLAAVLIIAHIACISVRQNMRRRYLCSAAWAREQGITPDRLSLFSFRG